MKLNLVLILGLASMAVASPVVQRDDATDLVTLMSTVKNHTASINSTLAKLPTATTSATNTTTTTAATNTSLSSTGSDNITAHFSAIAQALTSATFDTASTTKKPRNLPALLSSRQDTQACDATCLTASYNGIGALTAEIAYTVKACVAKNAVDITTSTSVLVPVLQGLAIVTNELATVVGPVAGVVAQNLEAALGTEIGGALAAFISSA